MKSKEFVIFLITMVVGGLVYSVISFAYMNNSFTSKDITAAQDKRITRLENRNIKALELIGKELTIIKENQHKH